MASEHNPIAQLVHQIQQKWIDEVSPFHQIKIARWLIQPDQARLFEGFLKLESSEHGALPEILVAMLTPFKSENKYSPDLINDWNEAYKNDKKLHEYLVSVQKSTTWNVEDFSLKAPQQTMDYDKQFLDMLAAFHEKVVGDSRRIAIALFPHSIYDIDGLKRWLTLILKKGIPDTVTFMIFDHIGENYFDSVFEKFPDDTKTLHIDLDLDGAISKIARMGDANSPEVQFRKCILEMGKAVQKNDQLLLDNWGEKALQITQKSGLKSMYASAHIVYAGMLFTFRKFDKIDTLLNTGLRIATLGLKSDKVACQPLIIQFHGYIAASKQLQKKTKEAIIAFEKQGDVASEYQLPAMALTPYWQAYTLSKKAEPFRFEELLHKAYGVRKSMQQEELSNSSFAVIAYDYIKWLESKQELEKARETDKDFKEIFGDDWKEEVNKPETSLTKKRQSFVVEQ